MSEEARYQIPMDEPLRGSIQRAAPQRSAVTRQERSVAVDTHRKSEVSIVCTRGCEYESPEGSGSRQRSAGYRVTHRGLAGRPLRSRFAQEDEREERHESEMQRDVFASSVAPGSSPKEAPREAGKV